jgi:hypothetical protein
VGERLPAARPCGFVLQELADLGEREPRVVAQLLDEPEALDVGRVVQPVVALTPRRGRQQTELFVLADRARGQPELRGNPLDAHEVGLGGLVGRG